MKSSRTNMTDSLASSAVLLMGEADEKKPLAIIQKAPVEFCNRTYRKKMKIDIGNNIYLPLFLKLAKKYKKL
jgi:dihydrofolate synthase / folylpolyglutamate synthase